MGMSLAQRLAQLPPEEIDAFLDALTDEQAEALTRDWKFWARPEQIAPDGGWLTWLILAGRGFGKTRAGAEWVIDQVEAGAKRGALVGRTAADVRDVMVEGESGLIACAERRGVEVVYEPSKRRVSFPKHGAFLTQFSAEEPDQTRGPQHEFAWADEIAAWPLKTDALGNSAWSNLLMGLRLGKQPQVCATTTPKNVPIIRELVKDATTVITRGSTYDNLANLAPSFRHTVVARYEGTRLGRQELMAELLEDVEGALWTAAQIEQCRTKERPELSKIVVAIDPPATSTGAECGIVVAGRGFDEHGYVLADRSRRGTPDEWARAALQSYLDFGADELVIETNQGGDMVEHTIKTTAAAMTASGAPLRTVKVKRVHASRGKRVRAEPVSALYEQGRVHHVGTPMAELEDQLTTWTPDAGASPDRLDALVWAITRLMLESTGATFREW